MADEPLPPILITPILPQMLNEGGNYYFDLNQYIESPNAISGTVRFFAELADGSPLPRGLICTTDGIIGGIPANNTRGQYEFVVIAENDSGLPFSTKFNFTIKERIALNDSSQYFTDLKAKVWDALGHDMPTPEIADLLNRPITADELYYLLQRMATLTIWDVFNLDPPGECKLLQLDGVSEHFNVYDRGSYLIGAPKDLFSHERTLEDAIQTAKAMAHEVYQRGWTIEFSGLDKMVRACWVELQLLIEKNKKPIEVIHYNPTHKDIRLFEMGLASDLTFERKR